MGKGDETIKIEGTVFSEKPMRFVSILTVCDISSAWVTAEAGYHRCRRLRTGMQPILFTTVNPITLTHPHGQEMLAETPQADDGVWVWVCLKNCFHPFQPMVYLHV
jgi:hypothetical protein